MAPLKVLLVWPDSLEYGKGQRQAEPAGWSKETRSCSLSVVAVGGSRAAACRSLLAVCVCLRVIFVPSQHVSSLL